jgi:hypothetical protein
MLDSHPLIWGMGEDSVFNANLTVLRDAVVQATSIGSAEQLQNVILDFGQSTVLGMRKMVRTAMGESRVSANNQKKLQSHTVSGEKDFKKLRHIVDKMLFNYRNIGKAVV